jgi:hypothetical protein
VEVPVTVPVGVGVAVGVAVEMAARPIVGVLVVVAEGLGVPVPSGGAAPTVPEPAGA